MPGIDLAALPPVQRCIAGADPQHWGRVRDTALELGAHFTLGIHPWFDAEPAMFDQIAAHEPDGLGEIGLDALRPHDRQLATARYQLERADGRPVVLHCVRAHAALLELVQDLGVHCGLVHAWTGSAELARRFVDQGLCVSFGPALLRSQKIQAAAAVVPEDQLLVETDGETTDDLLQLDAVLAGLAHARNTTIATIEACTSATYHRLFPREIP